MASNNDDLDLSGIKIKINGHLHEVTGVKNFVDDKQSGSDELQWIQVGLKDITSGHHQCIEIETSGLIKLWLSSSHLRSEINSFFNDITKVGTEFVTRVGNAIDAFIKKPDDKD